MALSTQRQPIRFPPELQDVLKTYPRVAIAGGPRCGKTTMARHVRDVIQDRRVLFDEDFRNLEWAVIPEAMIAATQNLSRFCLESVQVARALRKGLKVDAVIYLHRPRVSRTTRQIGMAKGVHTIFKQWRESDRETPVYMME